MADPASYRPASGQIPTSPGVYRFRDEHGRVIYVGKAKNLRNRLNSYFQQVSALSPKTYAMVHAAASVEWTVVKNEIDSLQLEYTWIKEYKPRYNIVFRDDKTYPYLAITMKDAFPRVQIMRGEKKKGVRYFGPYTQVWAIRETLETLLKVFPLRTCSAGVFRRAQKTGRSCLLGYINKCSAPCIGRISEEEHYELAQQLCRFMSGGSEKFIAELKQQMKAAAAELDFEKAAGLRDDLLALEKVFERNTVVLADSTHADFFAYAGDELEIAIQVFFVRAGKIRAQRGWIVERSGEEEDAALIEKLLMQVYGEYVLGESGEHDDQERNEFEIPPHIVVPVLPENQSRLEQWLSQCRGSSVRITSSPRAERRELLETVEENAQQSLAVHKLRRTGDLTTRSASLVELQEALELDVPLLRIECYDISHIQGAHAVASMVVFEDGLPQKNQYRKFTISEQNAGDDVASMYEVITRRFKRYLHEKSEGVRSFSSPDGASAEQSAPKFSYPPNLLLVDGASAQVAAAERALADLNIEGVYVAGIAKRLEEIWVLDDEFPIILPRSSQALFLIQRIRDEAHRFAITFHRSRRAKAMVASVLSGIDGLGEKKRQALLDYFGSLAEVKKASLQELQQVPGVGPALAQKIMEYFMVEAGESDVDTRGVDMSTGELLDS
ncbi:excinuclease ABC subunit UvrC [Rothia sp. P7208]|uniref:excinuclease ABC subunit UvrC n=1 Tax=Rothia sp. P7208 TaxID=3402660 RepID=UPI003AC2D69A